MKLCEILGAPALSGHLRERRLCASAKRRLRSLIVLASFIPAATLALAANTPPELNEESLSSTNPAQARTSDIGPARIQQSPQSRDPQNPSTPYREPSAPTRYIPSEFEQYVQRVVTESGANGTPIRRFGSELMSPANRASMFQEAGGSVPQDYVINTGDEVLITLWGAVEADLRLTVDRSGRIVIPRVGPVLVAGLRYADLATAVDQRVGQVFRNYKLSASLGRLRSIRIYVTGFTPRPGAYTVSSLSTLVNALIEAGGPSAAGSFSNVELRREGRLLTRFDLYDLLLKGDKSADRALQGEDVIHINAIGPQVALAGSVNKPAIFELKPAETLADIIAMAGGLTAVADRKRISVEQIENRDDKRIIELAIPENNKYAPKDGDLLRAYSSVVGILPQDKQNKSIRIDGEVNRPGEYILPASSTLGDAIRAAGGLTPSAFVFGAEFSRLSVRARQNENYERALRDLETEITRSTSTQKASTAEDVAAQNAKQQGTQRLLERLRSVRPSGRIVLQLQPQSRQLPEIALEDGDALTVPPVPKTISVFGSVFNNGSFLYADGRTVSDFLDLAGGTTRGADTSSIFVLRANGSVISARQKSGWLSGDSLSGIAAHPGDSVFVPEELDKTTFMQSAKDWTQILFQFGLGAAALKTIKN